MLCSIIILFQSAYAYTNEAVWLNMDSAANFKVKSARIVFGGVSDTVVRKFKSFATIPFQYHKRDILGLYVLYVIFL